MLLDQHGRPFRAPVGGQAEMWRTDPNTGEVFRVQQEDVESVLRHNQHLRDTLPSHHGHAAWRHTASIPATMAAQFARECGHPIGSREFAAYAKKQIVTKYPKLLVKGW